MNRRGQYVTDTDAARFDAGSGLFRWGSIGLLTRRNLIFTLMSIEVMLNASGLAFVAAVHAGGSRTDR